jgi:hypothetical protein
MRRNATAARDKTGGRQVTSTVEGMVAQCPQEDRTMSTYTCDYCGEDASEEPCNWCGNSGTNN